MAVTDSPHDQAGTTGPLNGLDRFVAKVLPGLTWTQAAWLNVVAQIGIIVTGGAVRLTGSGLGCPTWPECVPGSYTPVMHQAEAFHKWIEFGNRLLSFVVLAGCLALWLAARQVRHKARTQGTRPLPTAGIGLPLAIIAGVFLQAVIGGISVRVQLHPGVVAVHFMGSAILVAISAVCLFQARMWRAASAGRRVRWALPQNASTSRPIVRWVSIVTAILGVVVLVLGTLVTGSGPHSGDADTPHRLNLDPQKLSWLHADVVIAFLAGLAGIAIVAQATRWPAHVVKSAWLALSVGLAQGLIGYVQYFTKLPAILVGSHMFGAAVLTAMTAYMLCHVRMCLISSNESLEDPASTDA